jgi:2-methylfumaryl-CoA isomerase
MRSTASISTTQNEGDRFNARRQIGALVEPWIARRTLGEVRSAFDAAGVLWGPYQTFKQLVAEDSRASSTSPILADVDHGDLGIYRTAGSPIRFSGATAKPPAASPSLGEHSGAILLELLGLEGGAIAALRAEGVIN